MSEDEYANGRGPMAHTFKGSFTQHVLNTNLEDDSLTDYRSTYSGLEDNDSGLAELSIDEEHISSGVNKLIFDCRIRRASSLDLSRKGLEELPDAVLNLEQIEYLYLEGNSISHLPEEFFKCLPRLKWLDIRRNKLISIPGAYLGSHRCLETFLLEDNQLRTLPGELGFVRSLSGLNLRNNCLEFPPQEMINKGTKIILSFLRRMLKSRSGGNKSGIRSSGSLRSSSDLSSDIEEDTPSSFGSAREERKRPSRTVATSQLNTSSHRRNLNSDSVNSNVINYLTQSEKYLKPVDDIISDAKIKAKYADEKRLARIRNTKLKQDEIIQGWKHQEFVLNFKEETKLLQAKKLAKRRLKGYIDFTEPAITAPFHIGAEELKMLSNAERIEQNLMKVKRPEHRTLSPQTLAKLEEQRVYQEQVLRDKVRDHGLAMQERRLKHEGNPGEVMRVAQRDLTMALELQKEIEVRRKELQYGFAATGLFKTPTATKRQ